MYIYYTTNYVDQSKNRILRLNASFMNHNAAELSHNVHYNFINSLTKLYKLFHSPYFLTVNRLNTMYN